MKTRVLLFFAFGFHLLQAQTWNQMTKVIASDRDTTRFGFAVAISGDYAIVGAYQEVKDQNGLNPLTNAGAAYVFVREDCNWTFVQRLVASDRDAEDGFGYQISMDGDYAFIGAYQEDEPGVNTNAGAVYVFQNIGGIWTETQKLVASDRETGDNFGISVSVDGAYAVVGAMNEDENENGLDSILNAGSAYIYKNLSGTWTQVQKIVAGSRTANDLFALQVALDGDYLVCGAYRHALDATNMNFISAAGAAFVFKNTGGVWSQVQKLVSSDRATNDWFGWAVSISGDYIIAGATNEDHDENGLNFLNGAGSAYLFQNQSGVWTQVKKLVAQHRAALDQFGAYTTIDGDYAIVSDYREDFDCSGMNALANAGSAYMFKNTAGTWSLYQKICRTDRDEGDFFSLRTSIDGDYALIGSHLDDHDVQGGNFLTNSGSAYFFKLGTCAPPTAVCGVITVYVDPNNPVYDGPGTNNIWWIPEDDLDAGSSSSSQNHTLAVRRHLSQIPFDWTTQGACIDVALNGSVNNNDKGIVHRDCLPVRNADFNTWRLYQLRVQDQWGTTTCYGTVKVVPQAPALSTAPVVHIIYPPQREPSGDEDVDELLRQAQRFDDISVETGTLAVPLAYPNPGRDVLQLEWEAIEEERVTISVTDLRGGMISENVFHVTPGTNQVMFDMSEQPVGMYLVHFRSGKNLTVFRWIKITE